MTLTKSKFKRGEVPSPQVLEERLKELIEINGVTKKEVTTKWVQDHDSLLYERLRDYGKRVDGKRRAGTALRALGFDIRPIIEYDEILTFLRQVFSLEEITSLLETPVTVNVRQRIISHDTRGVQIYQAMVNKSRKNPTGKTGVPHFIDSIHPEHPNLYASLNRNGRNHPNLESALETLFYQGRSFQRGVLRRSSKQEAKIVSEIDRRVAESKKKHKPETYNSEICNILRKKRHLEHLRTTDVFTEGTGANKTVSLIAEREVILLLQILKQYDPELRGVGKEFHDFFKPPLLNVQWADRTHHLVMSAQASESDARVTCGEGCVLLEVKAPKEERILQLTKELHKYHDVTNWADGTPVNTRVLLLQSSAYSQQQADYLATKNWRVITEPVFRDFYKHGLELLLESNPHFFQTTQTHLNDATLLAMHDDLIQQSHLLATTGQRFKREWIAKSLGKLIKRMNPGSQEPLIPAKTIPMQYLTEFRGLNPLYGLGLPSTLQEDLLFYDLETTGFRKCGNTIIVLGIGYQSPCGPVVEQHFMRTPYDEEAALKRFKELAEGKTLIGFNSKNFDYAFLEERFAAHRLRFPKEQAHLDLYSEFFKDHAQKKGYPHQKLVTYERTKLGLVRHGDIPGSRIPSAYLDYVYHGDDTVVSPILHHNQLDVATMALLYEKFLRAQKSLF